MSGSRNELTKEVFSNEDIRNKVFESLDITIEMAEEKIKLVENWAKTLPDLPGRHMIEVFLILNKFDVSISQRKLEMYYKIRTIIPELYQNKNPALPHMRKIADVIYYVALPKLSTGYYLINVVKLKDVNSKNFKPYDFAAHMLNSGEIKLLSDEYALGEEFIFDLEGITLGHFFKIRIGVLKKLSRVLEEVYSSRVKGIHFINCPVFINALVSLAKAVLKPKLAQRIHVHKHCDDLNEFIPKEVLPEDYGGKEKSLEELNDLLKEKFKEYSYRFDELDMITVKMERTKKGNDGN